MEITLPDEDLRGLLDNPLVRGLLECSSDGAVVIDARSRRVIAINQRARDLLGRGADEGEGCSCRELLENPSCALACPLTRAKEGLPHDGETVALIYRRCDDEPVHADSRMLVVRGPDGQVLAGIELIRDQRELRALQRALRIRRSLHGLIGRSSAMQAVYDRIEELAPCDTPVLILGDDGTGKRRAAEALHAVSHRGPRPLEVATRATVASRRLPDFLARTLPRLAGGTLVLCRVDAADEDALGHLARLLTWGSVRWGDQALDLQGARVVLTAREDARLPRALQRALRDATVRMPRLADRLEDLPLLATALLRPDGLDGGTAACSTVSPEALAVLARRPWPGNVRQLAETIQAAAVRAGRGPIEPHHFDGPSAQDAIDGAPDEIRPLTLAEAEARAIDRAMRATGGNVSAAARLLGIDRSTLWRKLKRARA